MSRLILLIVEIKNIDFKSRYLSTSANINLLFVLKMLLIIEYFILFAPALIFVSIGLAMFLLALFIGSQGLLMGAIPMVFIEIFSLLALYNGF